MAIMNFLRARPQKEPVLREVFLFLINGFLATLIHFAALILFVNSAGLSYGLSNFLSFLVGSISSFLGNKFFVFKVKNKFRTSSQFIKFFFLYLALAFEHGVALYWWSDINEYNYIVGFLLITMLNIIISFIFNKYIIFNAK
jgi:putative flippase GtrA|tara:strand:- start:4494 stop:4919 length:426 start_codon:yes stop_codon:yes gene_type:complete